MKSEISEFVMFHDESQKKIDEALKESRIVAKKAALESEFVAFNDTKAYVIENLHKLKGMTIPLEITKITNLPSHQCVILEDLILMPYGEVETELKKVERAVKGIAIENKLSANECPDCNGDLISQFDAFQWRGKAFKGLRCKGCGTIWDKNCLFRNYREAYIALENEGRTS